MKTGFWRSWFGGFVVGAVAQTMLLAAILTMLLVGVAIDAPADQWPILIDVEPATTLRSPMAESRMFLSTGNALEAVVDAVKMRIQGDATLSALVTGVYGHVPGDARKNHPYLKIAAPALDQDAFGAMGIGGGQVTFTIDSWSSAKGPHEMRTVLARVLRLLERQDLTLDQHRMVSGSLHCTLSTVFDEPDPDMPDTGLLYHGHQDWAIDVEEVA